MKAIYKAFELNRALILASEQWAKGYDQAPEQHGQLMKASARLERKLIIYYRDMAKRADTFFSETAYNRAVAEVKATQVKAYDVNVIVNDDAITNEDGAFITVVFDEIAIATALGAQAGEVIYTIPLGIEKTDAAIQQLVQEHVASLVGKRVVYDGNGNVEKIIDNPNAEYRISDKTRADIKASIQTSVNLGEDVQDAAKRLQSVIRNPKRAALIADTETVNSYNKGLSHFGTASGAIGKQWRDNGAVDVCATNTSDGPIPFDLAFSSGHMEPTAHPRCKCYIRLIYQNELDKNPDLFR